MYLNSKIVLIIILLYQCFVIYCRKSNKITTEKPIQHKCKPSAGFVIYRRNFHGDIEFLLLQASYGDFHYSPPKGFVKGNETDMETAIRVTKEETGIQAAKDLEIFENFEKTLKYNVPPKGYLKEVHYWVARLINPHTAIKLTADHQAYAWWNVKDVLEYVETKELSSLLVVCDYYLNKTITESTTKE